MDQEESLKTIAKGGAIIFIGILISKLLTYFYRLIVARIGTEEYGLFSIGLAVLGILSSITIIGLDEGILRYVSFYREKKDLSKVKGIIIAGIKFIGIISIIASILLFIFSDYLAVNIFHNEKVAILLKLFAIAVPFASINFVFANVIKAFKKVKYIVYAENIIENIVKISLVAILLYFGYNIFGVVISYVISIIIGFFFLLYYSEKTFPVFNKKIKAVFINEELLKYSLPLLLSSIVFLVIMWTDTLMLGYFKTTSDVGIYNAASPTAQLLFIFPSAILTLLLPILTEHYAKNRMDLFKSIYITTTKWIFIVNLILLSLFIIFSKQILTIFFGPNYSSGSSTLIILSIGLLINFLFLTSNKVLMVVKRTKLIFINTLIAAVTNIILNIFLIPPYGIVGAAIATSIAYSLIGLLLFFESLIIVKINPLKLNYFKILISAFIATLVITQINKVLVTNIVNILIMLFIFSITYGLLLLITKSFEYDDIIILKILQDKTGFKINFLNKIIKRFL